MKSSRKSVHKKAHAIPEIRFEDHRLTSFAGLVIFQKFFALIELKSSLVQCFRHLGKGKVFGGATLFLQLIVHILLGFRELRDCQHYHDDPVVKRILGLEKLPDVATLSRMLRDADAKSVQRLRDLLKHVTVQRLAKLGLVRITLDFDGSVQSTKRHAQGTAVGFNKKKKGARSYYPLFCTIAQTAQVFSFVHRPGNVHDSNGAKDFILSSVEEVRRALPEVVIEVRMDSAFFSDEIVMALAEQRVEFTISVPFERFVELKRLIECRSRWIRMNEDVSYFESQWKPKSWNCRFRFLLVRTRSKKQQKGPVQLDLFEPYEYGHEFKVIVTNKGVGAQAIVEYHEGRGSQENVFGQLKTQCQMDYIPVRTCTGNQIYLLATVFAHNLVRELQMITQPRERGTTRGRAALWVFEQVDTLRKTVVQRAGRLTQPHGRLTLTICRGKRLKAQLLQILEQLDTIAA
ncbi:MAG TPA: IS1380 family transposase [Gammaproteobacteria bacterium]|nr:IS1380 family transposase [Gammaproteobacteria bacterium]